MMKKIVLWRTLLRPATSGVDPQIWGHYGIGMLRAFTTPRNDLLYIIECFGVYVPSGC